MGRMSNRERIARMAEEAEAARREKAEAAARRQAERTARAPATKKARTAPSRGRLKIVWRVCDAEGDTVKVFPYREKSRAEAELKRLTEQTRRTHLLKTDRVPMEDWE